MSFNFYSKMVRISLSSQRVIVNCANTIKIKITHFSTIEIHQILNPSARRHSRCASIYFVQAASPCSTIHSSLSFFVSGQAQHIFFLGFDSVEVDGVSVATTSDCFSGNVETLEPMRIETIKHRITEL